VANQFLSLYHRLEDDALTCLESICLHQGKVVVVSERHLNQLLDLDLIEFVQGYGWKLTWQGSGVANWHKQLREGLARKLPVPRPRPGENGGHLGPPCDDFRELLFSGIYCWCGRLRSEHPGEVIRTAQNLLAHHDRTRRLDPPQHRVTGRAFVQLAAELPSELRQFLQRLSPQGATLAELHQQWQGRLRFPAIEASLTYLAEKDLVYLDETELLWFPSWDGIGLANWLQEQFVHEALKKELPEVLPGENGNASSAETCDNFRPLLSRGGYSCWCGHTFARHPQ